MADFNRRRLIQALGSAALLAPLLAQGNNLARGQAMVRLGVTDLSFHLLPSWITQ